MRKRFLAGIIGVLLFGTVEYAQAGPSITGELWINSGNAFNATIANTPTYAPDADFNPLAINYDSRVTGYTIGAFLNNPTFYNTSAAWTANGGAAASADNTFFLFTGATYLNAGTNTFAAEHDDGFELRISGAFSNPGLTNPFDALEPSPTPPVLNTYTVYAPTTGYYNFTLSYGEVDGPPAVLLFDINGAPIGTAPEPSTLLLLGQGAAALLGLGWRNRRKLWTAAA